jgi:hypothetical protein
MKNIFAAQDRHKCSADSKDIKTVFVLAVLGAKWFYNCIVHSHTCTVKLPFKYSLHTPASISYRTCKGPYNLEVFLFLGRL